MTGECGRKGQQEAKGEQKRRMDEKYKIKARANGAGAAVVGDEGQGWQGHQHGVDAANTRNVWTEMRHGREI